MIIRSFNEEIRNDKETRKELGLVIKEKDRPRQLLTHLGTICFERDYFYDRNAEEYVTPLDRVLGIEKRERIGGSVKAAMIAQATDSSYAKSSAIVTGGQVSRQTVHDQILKMDVPEVQPYEEHKPCPHAKTRQGKGKEEQDGTAGHGNRGDSPAVRRKEPNDPPDAFFR